MSQRGVDATSRIPNYTAVHPACCGSGFPLSFFCQGVVLADVDRVCPITELYAHGLRFNHASTYREARDERQKHP